MASLQRYTRAVVQDFALHSLMKRTAPQAGGPSARAARVSAAAGALHLAAGDLDREYRTLGVLGRGNFSEVNLLRHRTSGELFALKTCCKLEAPSLEHLKRESTLMARVRHPFLLTPQRVVDQRGAPRTPHAPGRPRARRRGARPRAPRADRRAARPRARQAAPPTSRCSSTSARAAICCST